MSLKGTVILYTDLVFMYPHTSFVILDEYGQYMLVIENDGEDRRPIGSITTNAWEMSEWEDFGFEVIKPP